jgi:hypothetical protein
LRFDQFLIAFQLQAGVDLGCFGFGETGGLLVDGGLVGLSLDPKE